MRIALVVHNFPPESIAGTEVYVSNLAQEFSKDHEVLVVTRTKERSHAQYQVLKGRQGQVEIIRIANDYQDLLTFDMFYKNPVIDRIFYHLLKEFQPEVIHYHHLLNLSMGFIDVGIELKIPMVMTVHDYWYMCPRIQRIQPQGLQRCSEIVEKRCTQCLSSWLQPLDRIAWMDRSVVPLLLVQQEKDIQQRNHYMRQQLGKLDRIISPSKFCLEEYVRFGIPREKFLLLENGVMSFDTKPLKDRTVHTPLHFGFIGTLIPSKGVHILLAAFSQLPMGIAELHLYGPDCGYEYHEDYGREIRSYIEKREDIFFHGEFDPSALPHILENIDVLLIPAIWYENSPLTIQEALASSIPIVASRIGGIPEKITEGKNGFLFEPGNVQELAYYLKRCVESPLGSLFPFLENHNVTSVEAHAQKLTMIYHELKNSLSLCESST